MSVIPISLTAAAVAGVFLVLWRNLRRTRASLQRMEAYQRSLELVIAAPIFCISSDGTITDVDTAGEEITGWTRQDLTGRRFSRIFTEPERVEATLRRLPSLRILHGLNLKVRQRGGQTRTVRIEATFFGDVTEGTAGITAVIRDLNHLERETEPLPETTTPEPEPDIVCPPPLNDQDLVNVLDIAWLQSVLDDFQKLAGIALGILDLKGNILVQSGWQEVCLRFHRANPESARLCTESDLIFSGHGKRGEYHRYKCRHGLWSVMTPLYVSGCHVGNIYSGQFLMEGEEINQVHFADQAARYGFDRQAYLEALERVPRMSRERIRTVMEFLAKFAEQSGLLSYSNIQLAKAMKNQKWVEEALRERERHLRALIQRSPIPIALVGLDGAIQYLNDRFIETFGYSREELPDEETWWRLAFPYAEYRIRSQAAWQRVIEKAQQEEGEIDSFEFRVTCKDGSVLTVDTLGSVIGNSRMIIFNDITERKLAQECVNLLNQELDRRVEERTEQLQAAVSQQEAFSYSVSHDLRGPLRHINSYAAILREDFVDLLPKEAQRHLDRLVAASSRMGRLIDDLLLLSRVSRSEMKREKVDLSALAVEITQRLREGEPQRDVTFNIAEALTASGDPILLRQALENLLENAWKYTGKKPRAMIEFGRTDSEEGGLFFVRDNGAGFDMTFKEQLFGAFQRLHGDEYEGNGIGLATVQQIVSRHSGRVWGEGEVDRGATFYFTLEQ